MSRCEPLTTPLRTDDATEAVVTLALERDRLADENKEIRLHNEKLADDFAHHAAEYRELRKVFEERDKLQAFKDWVHAYLDGKGVPHHPPGTHGAAGCRIGDRMDWVWAELDDVREWNRQMLAVDSEWDEQALAKTLGVPLGESCRKGIAERVPLVLKELAELRAACEPIRRCSKLSKEGTDTFILWDDLKPLAALLARTLETPR
jgi:hypothetical protein